MEYPFSFPRRSQIVFRELLWRPRMEVPERGIISPRTVGSANDRSFTRPSRAPSGRMVRDVPLHDGRAHGSATGQVLPHLPLQDATASAPCGFPVLFAVQECCALGWRQHSPPEGQLEHQKGVPSPPGGWGPRDRCGRAAGHCVCTHVCMRPDLPSSKVTSPLGSGPIPGPHLL